MLTITAVRYAGVTEQGFKPPFADHNNLLNEKVDALANQATTTGYALANCQSSEKFPLQHVIRVFS